MKTHKLIPIIMMIFLTTIAVEGASIDLSKTGKSPQESTKTFKVSKGGKLYVNVNPGDIKISTWENNEVVVKVQGLDKDELENVNMSLNGNTVSVRYNPEWGWGDDAEFKITVPSKFEVEAKTSGGDIKLTSDIIGDVDFSSMGGDISAQDITGKTKLNTQGGDVKIGSVKGSLTLNTMGGDIRTGNVNGDYAKVTTMGGDITVGKVSSGIDAVTYGGDIKISGIGGNANIETMGGDIELRDANGKISIETKGGNLSVRNATGSIKANTYGGEIELLGITGSVDAKSMSGNITVELNPSTGTKSQIVTQNGEIELRLPSNVKADVSAEIRTWGNWKYMKDVYEIDSDFPKEQNKSSDKKRISAEYKINGGGAKIELRTTNGNISIKKN